MTIGKRHQFPMTALLDDCPIFQKNDFVGLCDGRQTMRNDNDQAIFGGLV